MNLDQGGDSETRFALLRFAPLRSALTRFARASFALLRFASLRSGTILRLTNRSPGKKRRLPRLHILSSASSITLTYC